MRIMLRKRESWWLYEWSANNGETWYPIHYNNMVSRTPAEHREIMNSLGPGVTLEVDGLYVRETKTLALAVNL